MTYFDCFVVGSWSFVIGWFLGAIYMQNQDEKRQSPRVMEQPERRTETEPLRLPVSASFAAD
jgi:hypothetical protein